MKESKTKILKLVIVIFVVAFIIPIIGSGYKTEKFKDFTIKIPKRWVRMNTHPLWEEINQMFGIAFEEQEEKVLYANKKNQMNALFLHEMKIPQKYIDFTTEALINELGMSDATRGILINNKTFFMAAEQLDLDYIVMGAFTKNRDTFYSFIAIFNNSDIITSDNVSKSIEKIFESIKFKTPEKQSEEKSQLAVVELREKERLELEAQQQRAQAEFQSMQNRIIEWIDSKLERLREREYELKEVSVLSPDYELLQEVRRHIRGFEWDRWQIERGNILPHYRDINELPLNPSN
jgi:hypothetical protein